MITFNIREFIDEITPHEALRDNSGDNYFNEYLGGQLLAIDPGSKQIGLALSNRKQTLIIDSLSYCVENLSQGIEFIKLKYFTENRKEKSSNATETSTNISTTNILVTETMAEKKEAKRPKKPNIIGIIIGFPFSHSRKNNWTETIIEFAKGLQEALKNFNIPIYFKDESYSTVSANFLTQNFTKKRQKQHKDRLAASCILQETLDIIALYKSESKEKIE